jgi:RimK family alpha-L-glutamate ligase
MLVAMRMLIAADGRTDTNVLLTHAFRRLGLDAAVVTSRQLPRALSPADAVLGRVDVSDRLDGVDGCIWNLRRVEPRVARVLNPTSALMAAHDKLLTALRLGRAGLPHPRTAHLDDRVPVPDRLAYPVVVKPRFGSWGRDVVLCESRSVLERALAELRARGWFRRHGALVQELVPPCGYDLRVVVSCGEIVGAVERVAAPGEWRTNVALGARRRPVAAVPHAARSLALAAAGAIGADLVGVDLLPCGERYVVLELNGAVDFTHEYSLDGRDVFDAAARALVRAASEAPALAHV